ncbi:MAG: dockerin type I domain-containing protein [Candidatus Bathyarchaeota archaeon]|nr:dockerin type I domain-containing protein [Candidatus Bathyarchaeota archaeon]MDH5793268.1 dockerin type I domain-containing protein [Candidatus Bathyarchaeota archaeon]
MLKRKTVFLALLIVIAALAQSEILPVLASEKEETPLYPVSGSAVDNQVFKSGDYTVANGFGVAITMDLPVEKMESTHARVAFAVCLGDQWEYHSLFNDWYYSPYVKEMRVKIQGDGDYEPLAGVIVDNTGTGGSSIPDFWTCVGILTTLFDIYQIALFLKELYQEPPNVEWKQEIHSVEPIVRQEGNPRKMPRLQTAAAWFSNYFKRSGLNTLSITAEAEIWLRTELHDIVGITVYHHYVGTYQVSYTVSILINPVLEVLAKQNGISLTTGDVYIDGHLVGYTGSKFPVAVGTHSVFVNDFWEGGGTGNRYSFKYYSYDSTRYYPNPATWSIVEDWTVTAQFNKKYCAGDVDGNGIVDLYDILFVRNTFGSKRGDPNWDSRADVIYDGIIDVLDALTVKQNLGSRYS